MVQRVPALLLLLPLEQGKSVTEGDVQVRIIGEAEAPGDLAADPVENDVDHFVGVGGEEDHVPGADPTTPADRPRRVLAQMAEDGGAEIPALGGIGVGGELNRDQALAPNVFAKAM